MKTTPTLIKEKGPLWYRILLSSSTAKRKGKINGDQEICRLGLKPLLIRVDNSTGKGTSNMDKFSMGKFSSKEARY